MKRMMLAMALILGAAATGAAEWRLGFLAGAQVADLKIVGVPSNEKKTRTAAAAGALFAWRAGNGWSVELRPGYTGGGARVVMQGAQSDLTADYFDVPLLITRDIGSATARPYLLAGGAVSYLRSAKAKLATGTVDIKGDFAGSDASLRIGAGLRGAAVSSQPFVEVEWSFGSRDLNARRTGLGAAVGAIHNRGIQIRAGLNFGLGKK